MKRFWLALPLLVPLLVAAGCGSAPNPIAAIAPASPQSVSLQQGDVPSGMKPCSNETGDITKVGTQDKQTGQEWQKQQAAGAKAGWVSVFTNDQSTCKSLGSTGGGPSSKNEQLLGSVVIQYRDEASASSAYTSGVLGFKPTDATQMQGAQTGNATGLGPNSAFASQPLGGYTFTVAIWQNKAFIAFIVGFGVTAADAKTGATNMNGRIH